MNTINASLENIKGALNNSALADDVAEMTKDMNQVAQDANTLNGQVNALLEVLIEQRIKESVSGGDATVTGGDAGSGTNIPLDAAIEALQAMQKELDIINSVVGSVLESTNDLAAEKAKQNVTQAMNNVKTVVDSCEKSVTNMQNIYKNNLVPRCRVY